jgi:hypothetical protein
MREFSEGIMANQDEYVGGVVPTNTIEGFWSIFNPNSWDAAQGQQVWSGG